MKDDLQLERPRGKGIIKDEAETILKKLKRTERHYNSGWELNSLMFIPNSVGF